MDTFDPSKLLSDLADARRDCVDPDRMDSRVEDNQRLNDLIREIKRHDASPEMLDKIQKTVTGAAGEPMFVEALKPGMVLGQAPPANDGLYDEAKRLGVTS